MILYDLRCSQGHQFEAWFKDSGTYDKQAKRGDVECPVCGGEIVERRSKKRGRVFYGCANYPECDFVSWDKPTKEKCTECGSFMVDKKTKTEDKKLCIKCDLNLNKKAADEDKDEEK